MSDTPRNDACKWTPITELVTLSCQLERELAEAKAILQKACAELPVSYYPDNTPEKLASNIAGFVKDYTENYVGMEDALTYLTAITSSHFYQSSCLGGEMERLMNQAIEALGGVK